MYVGDFASGAVVRRIFTTRQFSTGTPFTLAGSPACRVYKNNSLTQSTAGITLSADFDSVTGANLIEVDTGADAFYAAGADYNVVIQAGTVDGISVVGEKVMEFSINNRSLQNRVPVALSGGLMASDAQAFDASTAAVTQFVNALLGGTGIPVNVEQWRGVTPNALISGRVDSRPGAIATDAITGGAIAAGALTASKLGSDFFNAIQSLSVADATVVGSVFKLLVDKLSALTYGVGTGINANVIAMGGSTAWVQFVLDMMESSYVGTIGSATATTIVDTGLSGTFADHYKDREIVFLTGDAAENAVSITAYDAVTNTITHSGVVTGATPTTGDKYAVR